MFKKTFFVICVSLIIGGMVWYFFWQKQILVNAPGNMVKEEVVENALVEVIKRGIYIVNSDGKLGKELKTGDEVSGGQILMTDKIGLANLCFSDGSVARMESQTKISLENFEYFINSRSLKVKIFLQTGKIWSYVKGFVTPESYWEVQTTNAVAAVRGTSFGVSYIPGQTTIIGSVHLINVSAIDPQTEKLVKDSEAFVGENQYLTVNTQEIKSLILGIKLISKVKSYSAKIKSDPWVVKSKEEDKVADSL